jgi:hypothetical protein
MKTQTFRMSLFLSVGAASLVALGAAAQTDVSSPTSAPAAAPTDSAAPNLPYGVQDVLKLTRAQVSEDITLNYIHNSGTIYTLSPKDIVYLRDQGVSDKVIGAMMNQRQSVPTEVVNQNATAAQAASAAAAAAAPVPFGPESAPPPSGPVYVNSPMYIEQPPMYVPPEPEPAPASSLFVIPYGPSGYGYLPPYPYYSSGGCYGCGSTVFVVGRGYGGHHSYQGGHYHGGHGSTVYHFGHR